MTSMKTLLLSALPDNMTWMRHYAHHWKEYFFDGEYELTVLRNYVDPNRGAVDVGAATGSYSFHLGRLATWVLAFEPNPSFAQLLRDKNFQNVRVEEVALSSASAGHAKLRVPRVAGRGEEYGMASLETVAVPDNELARTFDIPLRSLDEYDLPDVGFIKIDVEGHEEKVIRGAEQTLRRSRPNLLIEIEQRHNPGGLDRVNEALTDLGYSGYFFDQGRACRLEEFDPSKHQLVSDDLNSKATHNRRETYYINNFLFVPDQAAAMRGDRPARPTVRTH